MTKFKDDFFRGMSKANGYELHVNLLVSACMLLVGGGGFIYFMLAESKSFFVGLFLLFICSGIVLAGFKNSMYFWKKIKNNKMPIKSDINPEIGRAHV